MHPVSARKLNQDCQCLSLDSNRLEANLKLHHPEMADLILQDRPHIFARHAVFLDGSDYRQMLALVEAVERCVSLEGYQSEALGRHDLPSPKAHREKGAFLSFDFHLSAKGPQLIEINTNAGGALLNAWLLDAAIPCCPDVGLELSDTLQGLRQRMLGMFQEELRLAGRNPQPRLVAIIDEAPEEQYLYPEFLLFKNLFEQAGWPTRIADSRQLQHQRGQLLLDNQVVDLVYNRCTDFYFQEEGHEALSNAFARGESVITPHPESHALYADKRNLVWMTQPSTLQAAGVAEADIQTLLSHIPETRLVTGATDWWAERKQWFFKPASGFGSRAAYRGDKLTRGTLEEILKGCSDYIAQRIVPPSERRIPAGDEAIQSLKTDFRLYAYDGKCLLIAARLYQGQTTNFRTPGGGFAPVFILEP